MISDYQLKSFEHFFQQTLASRIGLPGLPGLNAGRYHFELREFSTLPPEVLSVFRHTHHRLLLLISAHAGDDKKEPVGFVPCPTRYGSFIINGIERAGHCSLQLRNGIYFYRRDSTCCAKLLLANNFRIQLNYEADAEQIHFNVIGMKRKSLTLPVPKSAQKENPALTDIKMMLSLKDKTVLRISESIADLSIDGTLRECLNEIRGDRSASLKLELEDIVSIIYILINEFEITSACNNYSPNDLKNQTIVLSADSIARGIIKIFEKDKAFNQDYSLQGLRGQFPKNMYLRNNFRVLTDGKLFPFINRINPIALLSECRKVKRGSQNAFKLNIPKLERDVHPSHKGKICPIETVESEECGLTLYLAKDADIDTIATEIIPGRSIFGIAASLIPFIGHNEGVRATLGAKAMKQALLLSKREVPLIRTGTEREIAEQMPAELFGTFASFFVDGQLALGVNILTAYMPFRGYNFEDAIVISERLVKDDVLTSVHHHCIQVEIHADEIVEIYRKTGDVIRSNEAYGHKSVFGRERNDNLYPQNGVQGRIIKIQKMTAGGQELSLEQEFPFREPRNANRLLGVIRIVVEEMRKPTLGDKLVGRHGNKGVIGAIIPQDEMPHLPDGSPVDIILNPNGVVSRMNLGQLLETHYALLYNHRAVQDDDRRPLFTEDELEILSTVGKPFITIDFDKLSSMLERLLNQLFKNDSQGKHAEGKVLLRDGKKGEYFQHPCVVGYQYFMKLDHLADKKFSARNKGMKNEYSSVTLQPLRGVGRGSGLRIGEMEFNALMAHNVPAIINEILRRKSISPHHTSRGTMPPSSQMLIHFLFGMGVKLELTDQKQNAIDVTSYTGDVLGYRLSIVDQDRFLNEQKPGRVLNDVSVELMKVVEYRCTCGCTAFILRFGNNFALQNELKVSHLVPNTQMIDCAQCRVQISIESSESNGSKFRCKCGERPVHEAEVNDSKFLACPKCKNILCRTGQLQIGYRFSDTGIFSERIFGEGDARRYTFGYIELAQEVRHPLIKDSTIKYLPVIPPAFRPIRLNRRTMRFESSYINTAYEKVIRVNRKVQQLLQKDSELPQNALERAVAELFQSELPARKGLFDHLTGKSGILRGTIFGRRVDYSARAVIIPAPDLQLDECRLPIQIIRELFEEELEKHCIKQTDDPARISEYLRTNRPLVLLNRAPSLHKYNILAFYVSDIFYKDPVIGIHPLVCGGFGADHDGDQITVHIPLTHQAQSEAKKMLPSENIISDANGETFLHFEQDIILGLERCFRDTELSTILEAEISNITDSTLFKGVSSQQAWQNKNAKEKVREIVREVFKKYGNEKCARICDLLMRAGFEQATKTGASIGIFDFCELSAAMRPHSGHEIELKTEEDYSGYENGQKRALKSLLELQQSNPVAEIIQSGARGNADQAFQMVGSRGLVTTGRESFSSKFFISSNFLNGLNEEEYFYSAFKSRDSLMDKKLITPIAGSMLRLLSESLLTDEICGDDCGNEVQNRTPFNCLSDHGVCQKCYGFKPYTNDYYEIGARIGLIAAMSIGERSSQLSLQSIHVGKRNARSDIEVLQKLLNPPQLEKVEEQARYICDTYLPESKFIKECKSIKSFTNILDRHFSLVLRKIVVISQETKMKLLQDENADYFPLVKKGVEDNLILMNTLKEIPRGTHGFIPRFGFAQSRDTIMNEVKGSPHYLTSHPKERIFIGRYQ